MSGEFNLRLKLMRCLLTTLIATVVVSGVDGQEIDVDEPATADELAEIERLQNRIVPVTDELIGFQTGVLLGLTVDESKFSENWEFVYDHIAAFFDYEESGFILGTSFGFTNQGRFDTELHATQVEFGHVFTPYEGVIGFTWEDLIITSGWNTHVDAIDSPYSLFISSRKIPALNLDLSYDGKAFFINTRWIGLNLNSALGFLDRGMNFRTVGFKIKDPWDGVWRVGHQESAIYVDRYLDPLYTLAPIPYIWLQLFTAVAGNPAQVAPDPNTSLGLFLDYNQKQHYAYVQFFLDDLTISAQSTTVIKGAWSLGYRINTEVGSFGFYHAGATKFTYQATRTTDPYPYLYYPTNTYEVKGNAITAGTRVIPYFDNYIGYQYGENNLAFRAEYENSFGIVEVNGGLEYVVSGDKAPLNPWHAGASIDDVGGTQLLDSNRLEHTLLLDAGVVINVFEDVDVLVKGTVGFVANELTLTDPPASDGGEQYFIPGTGIKLLYSAFVGIQYNYNQHEPKWRKRYNRPQLRK